MNSEKLTPGSDENVIGSPFENQSPNPQAPDEDKAPPSSPQEQRSPEVPKLAAEARHSSRSKLVEKLRRDGTLQPPRGSRRRGRPGVLATWFLCVAVAMRDGTSLRAALARCGVTGLDERQIRALYRNTALQRMYRDRRRRYTKPLTIEELLGSKLY
jgi:hypothetical protein